MGKLAIKHPVFRQAPRVTFGRGSLRSALADIPQDSVFVVSSATSVLDIVNESAGRAGIELTKENCFEKPAGEPTADSVELTAEFLRNHGGKVVVAVGGGSVLDLARLGWARAFAGLVLETGRLSGPGASSRPKFVLVPTTSGTGAEAADVAVYLTPAGDKAALVDSLLLAESVVLDGRFLDRIGEPELASYVCDALSHAIEAGASVVPGGLAKSTAAMALQKLLSQMDDSLTDSSKDRLLEGSFLAGLAAANCSVGIVHAFAHAIGALGVPHGLANAVALIHGIRFNAATDQLRGWLVETHVGDVDSLIEAVSPIVTKALELVPAYPILHNVADRESAGSLAAAMRRDVALRSNPRRASDDELIAFIVDVGRDLS